VGVPLGSRHPCMAKHLLDDTDMNALLDQQSCGGEFGRRILRAYSRRVADGDIEALGLMTGLASELDDAIAIAQAVKGLCAQGYSWAEIGARLGVTRQAARSVHFPT